MKRSPHPGSPCAGSCPTDHLPGIGPSIREDLARVKVRTVTDMVAADPERLYAKLCRHDGVRHDPCVLYTFRAAHYAATHSRPRPELLLWWNWKDRTHA